MLCFQVCPLCGANLGKDVIGHFIVQHASSLKVLFTCFYLHMLACNSSHLLILELDWVFILIAFGFNICMISDLELVLVLN